MLTFRNTGKSAFVFLGSLHGFNDVFLNEPDKRRSQIINSNENPMLNRQQEKTYMQLPKDGIVINNLCDLFLYVRTKNSNDTKKYYYY